MVNTENGIAQSKVRDTNIGVPVKRKPGSGSIFFLFKECCCRVRVRVRVNTNPNPKNAFLKKKTKKIDPDLGSRNLTPRFTDAPNIVNFVFYTLTILKESNRM